MNVSPDCCRSLKTAEGRSQSVAVYDALRGQAPILLEDTIAHVFKMPRILRSYDQSATRHFLEINSDAAR
jgi:hypothetical protein